MTAFLVIDKKQLVFYTLRESQRTWLMDRFLQKALDAEKRVESPAVAPFG